jgi:glycosyltransferase involved in cell wall biosynthesis
MSDFVVIPAHNEQKNVGLIIRKIKVFTPNIVVVDDGSNDRTHIEAMANGAITLRHRINLGKGAALKTGCDFAVLNGARKIVVIDADGQHDPTHIPDFFSELNTRDIVFSYRSSNKKMPSILKFGNNFINGTMKSLYGIDIRDTQCGFRGFTTEAYGKIRWQASDYYMETEMIMKASRKKLQYTEIPIQTIYSDRYKGTTVIDGVKIVVKMVTRRAFK